MGAMHTDDTTIDGLHRSRDQLEAGLATIVASPRDNGTLAMVVRRPAENEREVLEKAELHQDHGVVGDSWRQRGSRRTDDGSAHPHMQLNLMNARVVDLVAGDRTRWALAGDQLYVDLDLSESGLPAWTRLAIGTAVIEITDQPHTGCAKFTQRFGLEAHRFVNAAEHRHLRLRGVNARVVHAGVVGAGDSITKLAPSAG
jgi:hypothetical protein